MKTMPIDDLKNILDTEKQKGAKDVAILDNENKTYGLRFVRVIENIVFLELSQQAAKNTIFNKDKLVEKMAINDLTSILDDSKENNATSVSVLDCSGKTHIVDFVRTVNGSILLEFGKNQIKGPKITQTGKERKTSQNPKRTEFKAYLESIDLNPDNYSCAVNTTITKLLQLSENAKDFEDFNTNLWEIDSPADLEKILKILFEDKPRNYKGYAKFIEMNERSSQTHFNALKKYLEFLQSRKS